jgi:hypothetical protein
MRAVRRALSLGLAVVPAFVTLALVITAVSDDSYYDDGRSYWGAHSDDAVRPLVVFAAMVNVAAAAALLASVRRSPPKMVLAGAALAAAGFALGVLAFFSLLGGH